jgi:2-succinyl-6-hydroxy-2,4-cyclohexadiene-1-carboxylate synthase
MKILFLHGMGGGPADWAKVSALLPGCALRLPEKLSWEKTVAALRAKFESEREDFLLVGYSMGGRLALAAAAGCENPKFRGLALVSTGLGFSSEQERSRRAEIDHAWAQRLRASGEGFWRAWYEQPLFRSFAELSAALKSPWLEARLALDPAEVIHQLVNLSPAAHQSLLPTLRSVQIPVRFIVGEGDEKYQALAESLAGEGIRTQLLPGGHILPWESPNELAGALVNFVRETESEK